MLVTGIAKKALKHILCIYYPVWFYNIEVLVLFDRNSKVNIMIFGYAQKLNLKV